LEESLVNSLFNYWKEVDEMRDPFANYDQWLEQPYQDMYAETDEFLDWCETHNMSPDDSASDLAYVAWIDEQTDNYWEYEDGYEEDDYYED
jgi:hypothetical protein